MSMLITAGKIIKPHGIRGEVSVESYVDSPSLFCGEVFLQTGKKKPKVYTSTGQRTHQNRTLVLFKEVSDRNTAEELRGSIILIPKSQLSEPDPGEVYFHDLIGLEVLEADSFENIGIITDISLNSGQEIWFIESPDGKEILFPAVAEFVEEIDLDAGKCVIRPPEGLLDIYL